MFHNSILGFVPILNLLVPILTRQSSSLYLAYTLIWRWWSQHDLFSFLANEALEDLLFSRLLFNVSTWEWLWFDNGNINISMPPKNVSPHVEFPTLNTSIKQQVDAPMHPPQNYTCPNGPWWNHTLLINRFHKSCTPTSPLVSLNPKLVTTYIVEPQAIPTTYIIEPQASHQ
jgi:hypothetical protein